MISPDASLYQNRGDGRREGAVDLATDAWKTDTRPTDLPADAAPRLDGAADGARDLGGDGPVADQAPVPDQAVPDQGATGCTWAQASSGTTSDLNGLWGSAAADVWAVGAAGTILGYGGTGWTSSTSSTSAALGGVWGSTASDVWAVGASGTILHNAGSGWTSVTSPTSQGLRAVAGCEASRTLTFLPTADASANATTPDVNAGSALLLYADQSPDQQEIFLRFTVTNLTGTVTGAKLRLYAVDGTTDGPTLRRCGGSWTESGITWNNRPSAVGPVIQDLGAVSDNTWVELDLGGVVTGDGTYDFVLTPMAADGLDVHARENTSSPELELTVAARDVWAVGEGGVIVHHDGTSATTVASPTTAGLRGVGACAPSPPTSSAPTTFTPAADAYVDDAFPSTNYGSAPTLVSDQGPNQQQAFLRFNVTGLAGTVGHARLRLYVSGASTDAPALYKTGGGWSEGTITWSNKPASTGSVIQDRYAASLAGWLEYDVTRVVTGNGTYNFVLIPTSTDGTDVHSREGANPPQLVLTMGSRSLWAVGDGGTLLAYKDGAWSTTTSPTSKDLHGVWGTATDAWVVGKAGAVLHGVSGAWTATTYLATADLLAVWGSGPTDIWAVGGTTGSPVGPVIAHHDGSGWSAATFPQQGLAALHAVWGSGPCDVWAAGAGGKLLHLAQ